jgi:SpoVK/Ycf46/Vps4 family AAA+-type ATPase
MNYDPHEVESVKREYKRQLDAAERAVDAGRHQEAAEAYREAAAAKKEIGRLRGSDPSARVQELHRIADRAAKGDPIRRSSGRPEDGDAGEGKPPSDAPEGADAASEFREVIESFIVDTDTTWDDIGGLTDTKTRLREALALGAVGEKPPAVQAAQSTLLFGPPGTGKTMLAAAMANESDATFFNVKLGSLLSKFYGQSSQKIIALFDVARELSPSVIFLDEIDALTSSRVSGGDDASRRVLNTLLSELSGLNDDPSFTFVLGATNTPWDLDFAIRRRFAHRILVPLPDPEACREVVRVHTTAGGVSFTGDPGEFIPATADPTGVVESPEDAIGRVCAQRGFSGSDIGTLANEAVSNMVHRVNPDLAERADESLEELQSTQLKTEPIRPREVIDAFEAVSASLSAEDIERFHEWNEEFGTK